MQKKKNRVVNMQPIFSPDTHMIRAIISMTVGNFINWLLYGVFTVQIYLYYLAFPNDRKWIKAAVYTIYILETVQVISYSITLLWITLITIGGGSHDSAFLYSPACFVQEALTALVSSVVPLIAQCIYANRIRIITEGKVVPGLIITLGILQFSAAIAVTTARSISTIILMAWAVINATNDLIIAFVMVRSLSKNQPLSDYTRMKVARLIHLIIATGSLTVTANFLSLASLPIGISFFHPSIGDLIAVPVFIFMPKLYGNSILVMLNNRMAIRDPRNATPNTSVDVVSMLVIADNQRRSSGSATPGDEVPFSSSVTTSAI